MIAGWRVSVRSVKTSEPLQPRNKNKLITVLHGVFRRAVQVWDLPVNPVALIEKYPEQYSRRHPGLLA